MSDPVQFSQSDFVRELERLHAALTVALKSKDDVAIEHAEHEMTLFLRMNHQGRLQEYFDSRQARNDA